MQLSGSVLIPAEPPRVWRALNDPLVLGRCIPGCEEVREVSASELLARVAIKLGPVRARFVGKISKHDVRENAGYRLEFEGSGGSAGFARGTSEVTLTPEGSHTQLSYSTEASVGGKLGQIGGRLIDVSARQLADQFFQTFSQQFRSGPDAKEGDALPAPVAAERPATPTDRSPVPALSGGISERARILWFALGALSTALGVLLGALLTH